MLRNLNYRVTHIYREGNEVADRLANHGLTLNAFVSWETPLYFSNESFYRNKQGMPNFRFCS